MAWFYFCLSYLHISTLGGGLLTFASREQHSIVAASFAQTNTTRFSSSVSKHLIQIINL